MSPCLHVSEVPQTRNGTNGKLQLPFAFCKRKKDTANFVSLLQTEAENENLFSWVGKR
jgi:hypothetical protein